MKKFITSIQSFTFILIVLTGCNVSKNVETPKAALPDTFRSAAATTDTSSVGDIPWKSFFTDATLQKLIDSAIVKNYDMQLALKNIEESQLLVKQVKWNNVPEVALNVTANKTSSKIILPILHFRGRLIYGVKSATKTKVRWLLTCKPQKLKNWYKPIS